MTIQKQEIRFSWSNYTKPTPENILGVASALRRLVALSAGVSVLMDANKWVPLGIIVFGWTLDELKNFAANVIEHEKESATAHFPSGEDVVVTKDTPESDKIS